MSGLKRDYVLVALIWLLFEVVWYLKFGFVFKLEATKYINEAGFLLENHHLSQSRYLFYLITILIIAFSFVLKLGVHGALIIIGLINLVACLYLFRALKKYFNSRQFAFLAIGIMMAFWPFQSWSLYLYTECIFYSLVMMLFARLMLYEKMNLSFLAGVSILLVLITLSRPLGILFWFPVLLFLYFHFNRRQRIYFYVALFCAVGALAWIVQIVFTTTHDWNMQRAFLEESIICDMPVNTKDRGLDVSDHPNQLYRLFYYISHNFSHFAGLAVVRLRYFFLMVRDYYSTLHNIYLLVHMGILYLAILIGWRNIRKTASKALLAFSISTILFFALAVAFQCDDYHNRFILTLTPVFVVLALTGVRPLLQKMFNSFSGPDRG